LQRIILKGKITTGHGEGAKFLNLLWVKKQIQKKLQFVPYAGTLNLLLSDESLKDKNLLKNAQYIKIEPVEGFCEGIIIPALIKSQTCAILIPTIVNYPNDMIEIIAPVNLRYKLKVKDGDELSVYFYI
jgi:riboflavin kinase